MFMLENDTFHTALLGKGGVLRNSMENHTTAAAHRSWVLVHCRCRDRWHGRRRMWSKQWRKWRGLQCGYAGRQAYVSRIDPDCRCLLYAGGLYADRPDCGCRRIFHALTS